MQGATQVEGSFAGKGLGLLVDTKLTITHQSAFMANKTNSLLGFIRSSVTTRSRDDLSPVLSLGEKT